MIIFSLLSLQLHPFHYLQVFVTNFVSYIVRSNGKGIVGAVKEELARQESIETNSINIWNLIDFYFDVNEVSLMR